MLSPGGVPERFPRGRAGFRSRGIYFLDREGSMWAAGFNGLGQVPIPDLRIWSLEDGTAGQAARYPLIFGDSVWVTYWHGASRLDPHGTIEAPTAYRANGRLCRVGDALWTMARVSVETP